jgi:hypothetical protein
MIFPPISPKLKAPFQAAFRRHCHRFLATGYTAALRRIQNDPDEETDSTGYICEALEKWFRNNPQESVGFFIKDDPPVCGTDKTGKRRPRTDIVIGYAAGARPEFCFEAKRLHRSKAVGSRYTSAVGMGCFITGLYARQSADAAMVGYVQTDTLEQWQGDLQNRVQDKARELALESIDAKLSFEYAFPLEWSSTHGRQNNSSVRIFHLLLDCRRVPQLPLLEPAKPQSFPSFRCVK